MKYKKDLKVLAFFSGGKDSIFSIIKAKENGLSVNYLLFNTHDFPRPNIHEINIHIVKTIANLIGIPLYVLHLEKGKEYKQLSNLFSKLNINCIIVGNISSIEQLNWYENLCKENNINIYAPLWGNSYDILINEINYGIKALICDLDTNKLSKDLIGKIIDKDVIKEFSSIDFCGEYGEYHTLVLDAPIMKGRIIVKDYEILEKWNRYMLKIREFMVIRK
ncbi:MAG: diphthine--ammonia ligase [Candidatus Verstraetearchaeota archaeon]|jgi:uncharacterized protein (TIGR00290 family)|nr:diphthine--ammonia ligase [Candidatus Verstraetearchaeota archaeon]